MKLADGRRTLGRRSNRPSHTAPCAKNGCCSGLYAFRRFLYRDDDWEKSAASRGSCWRRVPDEPLDSPHPSPAMPAENRELAGHGHRGYLMAANGRGCARKKHAAYRAPWPLPRPPRPAWRARDCGRSCCCDRGGRLPVPTAAPAGSARNSVHGTKRPVLWSARVSAGRRMIAYGVYRCPT
jgi:hypothetical protein